MATHVLAVEPSKAFRSVLSGLFKGVGAKCTILEEASDIEALLEQENFDFICLGLHLEGRSGLELCRVIRKVQKYRFTPIVLLTAEAAETTQTEAFSSGFTDIFHRKELADLEAYLKRHQEASKKTRGKILYVEDSRSQRMTMQAYLEDAGLEVDSFEAAEEAWQALLVNDYDLVLTDIVLPGAVSGLHLVHRIRRLGDPKGDIPIVAITGFDDSSRRVELLQRGVNDYVTKPVVPQEVLVRIRTLLKHRHLVARLQDQNQKIEEQSNNQLAFLASISHDVRTPLNGILGVLELMRSAQFNKQQQNWFNIAMQSGEHLISIVDDVLDLSRAAVGEFTIETEACSFKKIVLNVISNLKPQSDSKRLKVSADICENFPDTLLGDPKRFYQVLMNLAGNAVKFTDQGSVKVSVDYTENAALSGMKGMVTVAVEDTGSGIPGEKLDTVFKQFRQVDAVARSKGGSGLGLAIVKTIVDAWGGQVGVSSELGKGSRFWFSLPVEVVADVEGNEAEVSVEPIFDKSFFKVLLVEDNHINQLVAGSMLDQLGIEYGVAENGEQALAHLDNHMNVNLVLMDCQMPVMDGYEATARIRHTESDYQDIYVVALTASAMIEEERKCYRVGMNDFIPKPLQHDMLIQKLNVAWDKLKQENNS